MELNKILIIVLISALGCCSKSVPLGNEKEVLTDPPTCPPWANTSVVQFPNPDNCSTFWVCDNEVPKLVACQPGLLYNPEKQVCDWPRNVECATASSTQNPVSSSSSALRELIVEKFSDLPDCPPNSNTSVVQFPNPDNCSTFWVCDNEVPKLMPCPTGLWFSSSLKVCVLPRDSDCKMTSTTEMPPSTPSKSAKQKRDADFEVYSNPPDCPPNSNTSVVQFPNPDNCSTFWICDNEVAVLRPCPPGLWYSDKDKVCVLPKDSDCKMTTTTEMPPSTSIDSAQIKREADFEVYSNPPDCPPNSNTSVVQFPNPDNCSTFWICDNEVAVLRPCAPGLWYSDKDKVCVLPKDSDCKMSSTTQESTSSSTSSTNPTETTTENPTTLSSDLPTETTSQSDTTSNHPDTTTEPSDITDTTSGIPDTTS